MLDSRVRKEANHILSSALSAIRQQVIYAVVAGSHSFGLANEHSDVDIKGIYIAPFAEAVSSNGCRVVNNTINHHGVDDDDWEFHEINKFINLLLKCNPTVMETMYVDASLMLSLPSSPFSWVVEELRANAHRALSFRGVLNAFCGYARQQLIKGARKTLAYHLREEAPHLFARIADQVEDCHGKIREPVTAVNAICASELGDSEVAHWVNTHYDHKFFAHTIRLMSSGMHCVLTGEFCVVPPEIEFCRDVRYGRVSLTEVLNKYADLSLDESKLREQSPLPKQGDREFFDALLCEIRKFQVIG